MAEFSWPKCLKLLGLACGLMIFEAGCLVAFLSLGIGAQVAFTGILKLAFDHDLKEPWQAFISWYLLALLTQINLRMYRKCIYPTMESFIRGHRTLVLGIPRCLYFLIYCFCVFGIFREYEATHGYPPVYRLVVDTAPVPSRNHSRPEVTHYHWISVQEPQAADHKLRTFFFLAEMSYLVYATSQVLSVYMIRLSKGVPGFPMLPQFYSILSMTVLQMILTIFYSFPIVMCLIACHIFAVDGLSTFLFALCLSLSVALAASQLESASPFPTTAKIGPFYYFEGSHQAKINLTVGFLPGIALYYYSNSRSYPLNALNKEYLCYVYWTNTALLHTVKSMYMTTWKPQLVAGQQQQNGGRGGANLQPRAQGQQQMALQQGGRARPAEEDIEMGELGGRVVDGNAAAEVQEQLLEMATVASKDSSMTTEGATIRGEIAGKSDETQENRDEELKMKKSDEESLKQEVEDEVEAERPLKDVQASDFNENTLLL